MKPMGKRILSLLVAVLTFGLMSMALISCGNETQSSVKDYKYCIFYIQEVGDGLEGEKGREWEYKVSCHYNTEQLTVEYREGVMYQVSFEIYEADGTYRGERGDFGARGKPGTYYFDAPENAHDYATMKLVILEPVDPRVYPTAKFDPNGAIEYEDGERYVYEYDGEVHYPLIFGVYNGERIEPDKDLDRNGVNYCTDEEGQRILFPREIGIYTVLCRISPGKWSTAEENEKYFGVEATVTVEIIEKMTA